jgi:hypothetical protein
MASIVAVEVVPTLSSDHLDVLGILALIYAAGPKYERGRKVRAGGKGKSEGIEAGMDFIGWVRGALLKHGIPASVPDAILTHLAASSCIVLERSLNRNLALALAPRHRVPHRASLLQTHATALDDFLTMHLPGRELSGLWSHGLEHATPTPTGLLIGAIVHDEKTGEAVAEDLEWGPGVETFDLAVSPPIWNGQEIDPAFMQAVKKVLRETKD